MRRSALLLLPAIALLLAACNGEEAGDGPATTTSTTTTTTLPTPEAMVLSYELADGDEFTYEVDIDQTVELSSTGDAEVMGEEEIPGDAEIRLTGTTTFTQSVAEGPEPGTFEVTIVGDFSDLEVSGTVDGEPIEDAPDFAAMEPVNETIVVDVQGNVVSGGDEVDPLAGDLSALEGVGSPAATPGGFVGPVLSEREVTVGDTWTETEETPVPFGEGTITTETESSVTGVDEIGGADVLVIDTVTNTSRIELDMADFFAGFFGAFLPEDASEEEIAEIEALTEGFRFLISVDPSSSSTTTWFDSASGVTRRADTTSSMEMTMDVNLPDEATGEMVAFTMVMSIDQVVAYRLVDATEA